MPERSELSNVTTPESLETRVPIRHKSEAAGTHPSPVSLCPSARPEMEGSLLFGVVGGTAAAPRLQHLTEPLPVTPEILLHSGPVQPTEVFRFAAPCAGGACAHFDGANCRLAQRTVQLLPIAVEVLPPCKLRPRCQWWQQEGKAACLRCPVIVTDNYAASPIVEQAAQAESPEPP